MTERGRVYIKRRQDTFAERSEFFTPVDKKSD